MGLYPACNLPWISTAVNKYIENPQFSSKVEAYMYYLIPGDGTTNPVQGECPRCYSESTLTHTRDILSCPSNLVEYLKTQTCTGGFSIAGNTSYFCHITAKEVQQAPSVLASLVY
ncbi:hypothetical protein BGZ74_001909 [Mortierella antarctica]|nr:hypothetical protein BGZ74_001909 [Mortierella antarctica]